MYLETCKVLIFLSLRHIPSSRSSGLWEAASGRLNNCYQSVQDSGLREAGWCLEIAYEVYAGLYWDCHCILTRDWYTRLFRFEFKILCWGCLGSKSAKSCHPAVKATVRRSSAEPWRGSTKDLEGRHKYLGHSKKVHDVNKPKPQLTNLLSPHNPLNPEP